MGSGASLRPSDLQQGGLIDDIDVTFTAAEFVVYDYEGKADKPALCAHVTLTDDDGKEYEQYWSAGDPAFFMPSDDGSEAIPVGTRTGLSDVSNFAELLKSLVAAGFPEDRLESDITTLVGMRCHINRKPQPKRSGLINRGGQDGDKTVAVVTKIHNLPWEKPVKKAGAKAGTAAKPATKAPAAPAKPAPAAKTAAKPVAKKPVPPPVEEEAEVEAEAEADEADGGNSELDEIITMHLVQMLEANGGSIKKGALSPKLFKAMKDDPDNRVAAVARIFEDEFLMAGAEEGNWAYDGATVTSA